MSINNPLVIINSLTTTVIKQQNEIDDLRASLKLKVDNSALTGKHKDIEQQLDKERAASALLRSYFINKRDDLCAEVAQYVVDQSIASTRDIAYSAGILALSPIAVNLTDGFKAKSVQDSLEQLTRLKKEQKQNTSKPYSLVQNEGACR